MGEGVQLLQFTMIVWILTQSQMLLSTLGVA